MGDALEKARAYAKEGYIAKVYIDRDKRMHTPDPTAEKDPHRNDVFVGAVANYGGRICYKPSCEIDWWDDALDTFGSGLVALRATRRNFIYTAGKRLNEVRRAE